MAQSAGRRIRTSKAATPSLAIRPAWQSRVGRALGHLLVFVIFVAAWQLIVALGWVDPHYLSAPTDIAKAFVRGLGSSTLLVALGVTLFETLVGFLLAAIAGGVFGLLLYQFPTLNRLATPYITAFNSLPRLALAPLFVVWFGFDSTSRIAVVVSLVFFIVTLNTFAGLQNADSDHLLLATTLGATRRQLFRTFILPSAVPTIFAGLQLGLTYAFLGAVVSEMLSGSSGLGAQLTITLSTFQTPDFFATLLLLVIVATAISLAVRRLERRILRWQHFEQ